DAARAEEGPWEIAGAAAMLAGSGSKCLSLNVTRDPGPDDAITRPATRPTARADPARGRGAVAASATRDPGGSLVPGSVDAGSRNRAPAATAAGGLRGDVGARRRGDHVHPRSDRG